MPTDLSPAACSAEHPDGWICELTPGHADDHIALCGRRDHIRWFNPPAPRGCTCRYYRTSPEPTEIYDCVIPNGHVGWHHNASHEWSGAGECRALDSWQAPTPCPEIDSMGRHCILAVDHFPARHVSAEGIPWFDRCDAELPGGHRCKSYVRHNGPHHCEGREWTTRPPCPYNEPPGNYCCSLVSGHDGIHFRRGDNPHRPACASEFRGRRCTLPNEHQGPHHSFQRVSDGTLSFERWSVRNGVDVFLCEATHDDRVCDLAAHHLTRHRDADYTVSWPVSPEVSGILDFGEIEMTAHEGGPNLVEFFSDIDQEICGHAGPRYRCELQRNHGDYHAAANTEGDSEEWDDVGRPPNRPRCTDHYAVGNGIIIRCDLDEGHAGNLHSHHSEGTSGQWDEQNSIPDCESENEGLSCTKPEGHPGAHSADLDDSRAPGWYSCDVCEDTDSPLNPDGLCGPCAALPPHRESCTDHLCRGCAVVTFPVAPCPALSPGNLGTVPRECTLPLNHAGDHRNEIGTFWPNHGPVRFEEVTAEEFGNCPAIGPEDLGGPRECVLPSEHVGGHRNAIGISWYTAGRITVEEAEALLRGLIPAAASGEPPRCGSTQRFEADGEIPFHCQRPNGHPEDHYWTNNASETGVRTWPGPRSQFVNDLRLAVQHDVARRYSQAILLMRSLQARASGLGTSDPSCQARNGDGPERCLRPAGHNNDFHTAGGMVWDERNPTRPVRLEHSTAGVVLASAGSEWSLSHSVRPRGITPAPPAPRCDAASPGRRSISRQGNLPPAPPDHRCELAPNHVGSHRQGEHEWPAPPLPPPSNSRFSAGQLAWMTFAGQLAANLGRLAGACQCIDCQARPPMPCLVRTL